MPDRQGSSEGFETAADETRRKALRLGLGLAGAAVALDVMAAAKPTVSVLEAAKNLRNRGRQTPTGSHLGAKDDTLNSSPSRVFHQAQTQVHAAVSSDLAIAQQGTVLSGSAIQDVSPRDGLHWLERHWQNALEVGVPIVAGATIAKVAHGRVAAQRAIDSRFQHALTLLASTETASQADAAMELLSLLGNPKSEKYYQRIFATAVDHFRQRRVEGAAQGATVADFKFVPVLVFAASAICASLQRKGANIGDAREEHLNASSIHLDGLSLREADLSFVVLKQATFNRAVLSFANLSNAHLAGADLRHATLNNADLSKAILSGANLAGAQARDANLSHALLRNTNLERTNLSYAHLDGIELRDDVQVEGANIYRATGMTVELRKRLLDRGAIEQDSLLA